jgi:hypothetical protein
MKALVPVLAGIGLITSVISVDLWIELRSERQANSGMRTRLADGSAARMAAAPAPLVAAAASTPSTPNPTATADATARKPDSPAAKSGHPAATNPALEDERIERELMNDPEYRRLRIVQQRSYVELNNPGLAGELGLSEKEAARLFNLLSEIEIAEQVESLALVNNANPDQATVEETARRQAAQQRQQDESLRTMLGSKYSQWQEYQQTVGTRRRIRDLGQQLAQASVPLSEVQTRSLTAAVLSEQQRQRQTARIAARDFPSPDDPAYRAKMLEQQAKSTTEDNRRIVDAAAPVVSTRQLAVLRDLLEQQAEMSEVSLRLHLERRRLQSQQQPMAR